MTENNSQHLSSFASVDELVEFFDTNDVGNYLEQKPEVSFEVNLQKRTHFVAIEEKVADRLNKIAKQEQVSAEILINSWLEEKISTYTDVP
jgi:predicted HicB family RNase H-like nuclease